MKTRFVDFEGIHGSGKTACTWNLYHNLMKHSMNDKVYFEYVVDDEQENPCNLSFISALKKAELDAIIQKFAKHKERIVSNMEQYGEYYCFSIPFLETSTNCSIP